MAYIEREAAIKALMNDAPEQVGYSREDAADCIRYMDTADVAPVRHGRWVKEPPYISVGGEYKKALICSQCHSFFVSDGNTPWKMHNYCPNCGAKMDLEG